MGILNMDAVKQAREKMESGSGNIGWAKLNQGRNVIRVLFPKGDNQIFYAEGSVHYGLGEDGKGMATCPKTFDEHKRCPICEYVEKLQKSKDKNDQTLGSKLRRRKRIYINVINRDDESDTAEEPKVLPIGVMILKPLLDVICDPDYGDITHPTDGRDVTITRKGQGLKTEYSVVVKPNTSPASTKYTQEELETHMADLESLFKEPTFEELENLLKGDSGDEDNTSEMDGGNAKESSGNSSEEVYDEMDEEELRNLCEQRGIPLPDKASKFKMIMYLTQYDDEHKSESDDVMGAIGDAISSRKNA